MPKQVSEKDLEAIVIAVAKFPEGASVEEVRGTMDRKLPRRTLQRRLALLVQQKKLAVKGRGRASRYRLPVVVVEAPGVAAGRSTVELMT